MRRKVLAAQEALAAVVEEHRAVQQVLVAQTEVTAQKVLEAPQGLVAQGKAQPLMNLKTRHYRFTLAAVVAVFPIWEVVQLALVALVAVARWIHNHKR